MTKIRTILLCLGILAAAAYAALSPVLPQGFPGEICSGCFWGNPTASEGIPRGSQLAPMFERTLSPSGNGFVFRGNGGGYNVAPAITSVATSYPLSGGTITTTGTLTYLGHQQQGQLFFVNSTTIRFAPYKGDLIKINGALLQIPSGGIAGCGNSSVFVGGVAAQNLAASTLYYVYAFSNTGTLTCDFSTTTHATSATAGNIGTEIETGDDTRSLIGLVFTSSATPGLFVDSATSRNVASWFNQLPRDVTGVLTANRAITNQATFVEAHSEIRVDWVSWITESIACVGTPSNFNTALGDTSWTTFGLSSNNGGAFTAQDGGSALNGSTATSAAGINLSISNTQGHWMATLMGTINTANSVTYLGSATAGRRTAISCTIIH